MAVAGPSSRGRAGTTLAPEKHRRSGRLAPKQGAGAKPARKEISMAMSANIHDVTEAQVRLIQYGDNEYVTLSFETGGAKSRVVIFSDVETIARLIDKVQLELSGLLDDQHEADKHLEEVFGCVGCEARAADESIARL
jgi:hypothetical protein